MSDEYLWINKWEEFQSFQTKRGKPWTPPWIKLYPQLLRDHDFVSLPEREQLLLLKLFMLFASTRGLVPKSTRTLSHWLGQRVVIANIERLNEAGWINVCSRTVLEQRRSAFWNSSSLEVDKTRKNYVDEPVENSGQGKNTSQETFLAFADQIGLVASQRLDALNLGQTLLEEAMRATLRKGPRNKAAYFTGCVQGLLTVQRKWRSSMPLEKRLEIYVKNAGHDYRDPDLIEELREKGADDLMVQRLLKVAQERRAELA